VKAFEEFVFGPCTLGRTWGTRPETKDRGWEINNYAAAHLAPKKKLCGGDRAYRAHHDFP
jgi:hypothetical protein